MRHTWIRISCHAFKFQACRKRGGWGALDSPNVLAEQLTLSQPGEVGYAHHSTTSPLPPPRIFRPCESPEFYEGIVLAASIQVQFVRLVSKELNPFECHLVN